MGKAKTEIQVLTLYRGFETHAFDFEILRETFTHAHDHVVHQRAGKTVQCFDAATLRAARERNVIVLYGRFDLARQFPIELAFRAFDRNAAVIVDVDFDFIGNVDRLISNSRHKITKRRRAIRRLLFVS